jgi:hypothetical protein
MLRATESSSLQSKEAALKLDAIRARVHRKRPYINERSTPAAESAPPSPSPAAEASPREPAQVKPVKKRFKGRGRHAAGGLGTDGADADAQASLAGENGGRNDAVGIKSEHDAFSVSAACVCVCVGASVRVLQNGHASRYGEQGEEEHVHVPV